MPDRRANPGGRDEGSLFATILGIAGRDGLPEVADAMVATRAGLEAIREEIEKLLADSPCGTEVCLRAGKLAEMRASVERGRALAAGGAALIVLGEPGGDDASPGDAGIAFVPVSGRWENEWFLLVRGTGLAVALLARRIAEGREEVLPRYNALLTFRPQLVEAAFEAVALDPAAAEALTAGLADRIEAGTPPDPAGILEVRLARRLAGRLAGLTAQLHRNTLVDALTGLFNQRHFYDSLVREANRFNRRQRGFTLLFVEIEGPGSEGAVGETAVRALAEILQRMLRRGGDLPCRLAPREFGIILDGSRDRDAAVAAVRIESAFAELNLPRLRLKVRVTECATPRTVSTILAFARGRLDEQDL